MYGDQHVVLQERVGAGAVGRDRVEDPERVGDGGHQPEEAHRHQAHDR
jgi:hypothetical protein